MSSVQSATLDVNQHTEYEVHQLYCGLDNALTHESLQREFELFDSNTNPRPQAKLIYGFERALQAPYLDVMLRGFRVDTEAREAACLNLSRRINRLQSNLNRISEGLWGKGLNARSNKMLREFFYDAMKLKEIITSKKGVKKVSLDRPALERLSEQYLYARPFISHILSIRDLSKQLEVFATQIDPDNRFRSSYNIAGTETGRPSSSESAMGTGGNMQNIAPGLRHVFVADPGYILFLIDFEQSEARDVGFIIGSLFGDWSYLDACESGDLHTANAKLVWPDLKWSGDPIMDRKIADQPFYRDFSYRDMAKRGSHLCLTEDHEVLTPGGWVPVEDKPYAIMAWSEKNGSDFEKVEHWTDELYNNKLVYFEGNSISLCMTESHRVPYKSDQRNNSLDIRRAIDGPGRYMPLGWGYKGGDEEVPARLIAAFMSDGSQASTNRMYFHLKKPRKIARLKYLCSIYNFEYEELKNDIVSVHGSLPKRTGSFMFEWTTECIKDFIDEYKHWDGHISKTAVSLFSVNKDHLDWIKTFGRLVGIGGNINTSIIHSNFSGTTKEYTTTYYTLQQNHRLWGTGRSVFFMTEDTKEPVRVLCPTVKSQFFYVRRNGKICVTGNSNYMGTAFTMARHLKVPQKVADEFQSRYCRGSNAAFPCIPLYWQWAIEQIQTTYKIITPFGRERHFFGNTRDDATAREAIAFVPQSTTSDRTNLGFWRVWKHLPQVELLAQGYDSITFQVKEDSNTKEIVREVARLLQTKLTDDKSGRSYSVPVDVKAGHNWGYASDANPKGLKKYSLK
jgi:DNA polymerase I-like protein with 3'-5' exonuclease and polymerase domains